MTTSNVELKRKITETWTELQHKASTNLKQPFTLSTRPQWLVTGWHPGSIDMVNWRWQQRTNPEWTKITKLGYRNEHPNTCLCKTATDSSIAELHNYSSHVKGWLTLIHN